MVADERYCEVRNRVKSQLGQSQAYKVHAGTQVPQGALRLQAKQGGATPRRAKEIEVIIVRPSVPKPDVLDKVYGILAASEAEE